MADKIRSGRPSAGESAPTMKTIHVRIPQETVAALARLERSLGAGHMKRGKTSIVVRQLIHAADDRLRGK
jgi:hypothetical protein